MTLKQKIAMYYRLWKRRILYPSYECIDCLGMNQYGCYCAHYECVAPCTPPEWWRVLLRRYWK